MLKDMHLKIASLIRFNGFVAARLFPGSSHGKLCIPCCTCGPGEEDSALGTRERGDRGGECWSRSRLELSAMQIDPEAAAESLKRGC